MQGKKPKIIGKLRYAISLVTTTFNAFQKEWWATYERHETFKAVKRTQAPVAADLAQHVASVAKARRMLGHLREHAKCRRILKAQAGVAEDSAAVPGHPQPRHPLKPKGQVQV